MTNTLPARAGDPDDYDTWFRARLLAIADDATGVPGHLRALAKTLAHEPTEMPRWTLADLWPDADPRPVRPSDVLIGAWLWRTLSEAGAEGVPDATS